MAKKNRKKNIWWLVLVLVILILSGYAVWMYWLSMRQQNESKFAMYPAFGIDMPLGFKIHGIDVSSYQNYIYWPSVRKMNAEDISIKFAFIKATEGLENVDKQFKRNWLQCKQAGIVRGAYHYFLATKDGIAQAKNFIATVKLEAGDLPPVLDVENLYGVSPALALQRMNDWVQTIKNAYHVQPIIYSYADFFDKYLADACKNYPIWLAHYFAEQTPQINCPWVFWQHNDGGHVNGITTKVDFNVFNGDSLSFAKMLIR